MADISSKDRRKSETLKLLGYAARLLSNIENGGVRSGIFSTFENSFKSQVTLWNLKTPMMSSLFIVCNGGGKNITVSAKTSLTVSDLGCKNFYIPLTTPRGLTLLSVFELKHGVWHRNEGGKVVILILSYASCCSLIHLWANVWLNLSSKEVCPTEVQLLFLINSSLALNFWFKKLSFVSNVLFTGVLSGCFPWRLLCR